MSSYAAWNQYAAYAIGDVVTYAGLNYVAAAPSQGVPPFPVTPDWTILTPPLPPGTLTNPLTTDLDLGSNQIINSTVVETEIITKPAGSIAPSIEIQEPMTFVSVTPTLFNGAIPQTALVPSVGDDLCNKTYVDSAVAGAGGGVPGPEQTYSAIGTTSGATILSNTSFTLTATGQSVFATSPLALNSLQTVFFTCKPPIVSGPDFLNISFFIPSQYGYLIYPNLLVPVRAGVADFGGAFAFAAGDNAGLAITPTQVTYCLNGTPITTEPVSNPTTTATYSFSATNATLAPYTVTDLLLYSTISKATNALVNLPGIYNYLSIVPTAIGQTSSTQTYTSVPTPSAWVPNATPNTTIVPAVTGPGTPWRLTKPAGAPGTGQRWWVWPYNLYPTVGAPGPLSTPPTPPGVPILKKNLNALYAILRVKTANIATQGSFFWNIYTYDAAAAPASNYSNRFDYQANNLALPYTTGALAFQTEFLYLVYACDAEKIVATPSVSTTITQCNGQTPTQLTSQMLRDPYDIHTDLPHIPLSAVAVANGSVIPSDISNVNVSALIFGTTSSALTTGCDIELVAVGYRANGGAINVEYNLQYS